MKRFMIGFLMLLSFSAFATTLSLYQNPDSKSNVIATVKEGQASFSNYMKKNLENMTQLNQNLGPLWAVSPGDDKLNKKS